MKVADGVEMLEISMKVMGSPNVIHPTLIWDNNSVVLVDAGLPGQLQEINETMAGSGVLFSSLDSIIVTHQDIDHIGGLPEIIKQSDHKIEVLSHEEEKPYVEGKKPLLKMNPERMARLLENLPPESRTGVEAIFKNPPRAGVDRTVTDGEVLPCCGGVTVIHTPGHTSGHICLYLNRSKILIAGDALIVAEGKLLGPNPHATFDMEAAVKSLEKLKYYDIEKVICYHGGLYSDKPNQRLAELIENTAFAPEKSR